MFGAHQNLNGSRDLTTPFQGRFAIRCPELSTDNLPTTFEISNFTHYEDMKRETKRQKWGDLG